MRQYRQLEAVLQQELGVGPDPAIKAMYEDFVIGNRPKMGD
jgi:DNA-binding SARP family transcriptional activator